MIMLQTTYFSRPILRRHTIDWEELRRRLEQSRKAIDCGEIVETERFRALLMERTQRLANIDRDEHIEQRSSMLVCRTAAEDYAFPLDAIAAVAPIAESTVPPRASFALVGAMNLHGVIHRIFDLGRMIRGTQESESGGHILILRNSDYPTGLRVDRAERIMEINSKWLGFSQTTHRLTRWTLGAIDGIQIINMAVITKYLANCQPV